MPLQLRHLPTVWNLLPWNQTHSSLMVNVAFISWLLYCQHSPISAKSAGTSRMGQTLPNCCLLENSYLQMLWVVKAALLSKHTPLTVLTWPHSWPFLTISLQMWQELTTMSSKKRVTRMVRYATMTLQADKWNTLSKVTSTSPVKEKRLSVSNGVMLPDYKKNSQVLTCEFFL